LSNIKTLNPFVAFCEARRSYLDKRGLIAHFPYSTLNTSDVLTPWAPTNSEKAVMNTINAAYRKKSYDQLKEAQRNAVRLAQRTSLSNRGRIVIKNRLKQLQIKVNTVQRGPRAANEFGSPHAAASVSGSAFGEQAAMAPEPAGRSNAGSKRAKTPKKKNKALGVVTPTIGMFKQMRTAMKGAAGTVGRVVGGAVKAVVTGAGKKGRGTPMSANATHLQASAAAASAQAMRPAETDQRFQSEFSALSPEQQEAFLAWRAGRAA
jgi:hypothetical protein